MKQTRRSNTAKHPPPRHRLAEISSNRCSLFTLSFLLPTTRTHSPWADATPNQPPQPPGHPSLPARVPSRHRRNLPNRRRCRTPPGPIPMPRSSTRFTRCTSASRRISPRRGTRWVCRGCVHVLPTRPGRPCYRDDPDAGLVALAPALAVMLYYRLDDQTERARARMSTVD